MLAAKENGVWKKYSTQEVAETVNHLSAGLINLGISCGDMSVESRDKVAIISKNRPEWLLIDLAVQRIGAILTPIYPTINTNELEFVFRDAGVKMVFVNNEDAYNKVMSVKDTIPSLTQVYTIEDVPGARSWKEVIAKSTPEARDQAKSISDQIGNDDLATLIYTSGTTGFPKGVMLSHKNILSNVLASLPCFPPGKDLKALSFLPLNHIFERMVSYLYLFNGTSIYYAEGLDTIVTNLKEVRPNMFTTVPLLLSRVYEGIMSKGNELTGIKRKLFFWAHDLATKYEINKNQGPWYTMQLAIANKLIFSKWREALGNDLRCIVTGGAACQVKFIRIFTAAKIPIMEGYGLTETSPVIAVNRYNVEDRMFGTVGPIIDGVEVKIAEDGEILCKGPNIMMGYYKRADLTSEVMTGEWFHTGDIGMLVEGRFLKITDRKKEMFKTSGGKYVAPLAIENKFKESRFIDQLLVVGAERKFVGALIVPAFKNLKNWANENGIDSENVEDLINNPRVLALYRDIVESYNKNFSHVEQIKKFELLGKEWTIDSGEMTPKLSLKRKVIMEKYRDAIERIYSDVATTAN